MKESATKKRIEKVFNKTIENVRNGKRPNVSGAMLDTGYSKSSAKALKVQTTKTWSNLINQYDDEPILRVIYNDAIKDKDKRNATANRKLYLQAKGLLKHNIVTERADAEDYQDIE